MANWCYNNLTIEGDPEKVAAAVKELNEMIARQKADLGGRGVLPLKLPNDFEGWFFYLESEDDEVFRYETKWSPNLKVLVKFGAHHGVDFRHNYDESGNWLWGESKMENGVFLHRQVPMEDYGEVELIDEEENIWDYKGERFESEWEAYETILERQAWESRTFED